MKIKKGDQVEIIAGKDRGKRGAVIRVFPSVERVIVEGLNIAKRHRKTKREGEKGERVEIPMPIHVSNCMVVDSETGKRSRVGYAVNGNEKVRVAKKSGKPLSA
jgi:large subunit ribosomal protein L24